MSLSNDNYIRYTLITSIIVAIVCTKRDNNDTYDTTPAFMDHTTQLSAYINNLTNMWKYNFHFYIFIIII